MNKHLLQTIFLIMCMCIFFFFSLWLMFSTFSYKDGSMLIASKAWSDFASHIPLIRSFSFGNNFPPQYPLFSGEPIHYHFLWYFLVGMFERLGIQIDYALNIPSAIGFFSLLIMIYIFSKNIFFSRAVGIVSILFFLFNGSLSFLYFFKNRTINLTVIHDILNNSTFSSFGPYDNGIISAFWNLNIYTNQRHLAPALSISIFIIYIFLLPEIKNSVIPKKVFFLLGILLGFSFFFHLTMFIATLIVIFSLSLFFPKRIQSGLIICFVSILIAIPQYIYLHSGEQNFYFIMRPGYLIADHLSVVNFVQYWVYNLGLHIILIPIGFFLVSKKIKKLFLSFFLIFIVGNIFQFSPDIAANHKFFNYFMIMGNMFSAYVLVSLWKKNIITKVLTATIFFLLILSGVIDFFPIYNDSKIQLSDYPIQKDVTWIMKNTHPSAVFLNSSFLYNHASLAGRKIFLGWPYFAWSAGYDTNKRGKILTEILTGTDKYTVCKLLQDNGIDYLEIENKSDPNLPPISDLFTKTFRSIYLNENQTYYIQEVKTNCNYL